MSIDGEYASLARTLGDGARVLAFSPPDDLAQAIVDGGWSLALAGEDPVRGSFDAIVLPARRDELEAALDTVAAALAPRGRVLVPLTVDADDAGREERVLEIEYLLARAGLAVSSIDESLLEANSMPVEALAPLARLAAHAAAAGEACEKLRAALDERDARLAELAEAAERASKRNARLRSLLLDAHDAAVSRELTAPSTKAPPTRHSGSRSLAACTIISRNYLSQARILARTFLEHEPDGRFYLLVVDELPDVDAGAGIRVVPPAELGLSSFWEMCFKYNVVEFATAVKPSLLSLLLNGYGEERVVYLDPDILVAAPLAEVHRALAEASVVLTPHILRPIPNDGKTPSERDILISGAYNLGFLALRRCAAVDSFLEWWSDRLEDGCRIDVAGGLFTDQKWVDLVPGIVDGTAILRDDTYNVAFWNLHERTIDRDGPVFLVNGRPLTFFHASGFDPETRLVLSKHQNRTRVEPGTGLAELLDLYARLQFEYGYRECSTWAYGYSHFENGISVNPLLRRLYLDLDERARARFGNPFATNRPESFLAWATTPATEPPHLSPFLAALYRERFDVAAAFADVAGSDREGFFEWARNQGASELPYEPELVRDDVQNTGGAPSAPAPTPRPTSDALPYEDLVQRIREVVASSLPPDSTVAVVSRGDDELVRFGGHRGWHFPQNGDGMWAGYYPRDSAGAIAHLEALRKQGAEYLVFPDTGRWWLEHPTYAGFAEHLRTHFKIATRCDHAYEIFELHEPVRADKQAPSGQPPAADTPEPDAPRLSRWVGRLRHRSPRSKTATTR
jgi:hypothetical protein